MKKAVIATIIFGFWVVWCFFTIHGIVQLSTAAERAEAVEAWKARAIASELAREEYERIVPILPVLRQLLTPVAWLELKALAERNRQEKIKKTKKNRSFFEYKLEVK